MLSTCRYMIALIALFCGLCSAAGAEVLTLAEARSRALAQNPGLGEIRARYEALRQLVPQQGSLPDPVLSVSAANFPWDEFDRNQENMTQLQLGISQTFPYPGKRALMEAAADFEAEAAMHSVAEMQVGLAGDVALGWWSLYFLDRSQDTIARNQVLLRQLVNVAQAKYEVGNGLQQDVLLAQLELSKLLDQAIEIRAMRDAGAIHFNLLLGQPPGAPVELPKSGPAELRALAPAETLYERAASSRPSLAVQDAVTRASESRLALARKSYYPDFTVGVRYGHRDEDRFGQSRQDFLSVMLSVQVPLYAGSRQDRQVVQRERELARSQYAALDERSRVLAAIATAANDYRRAREKLELFDKGIVPQARQTVASMLAGYQVGQVDFLNLVGSQVTLLDYELQYWQSYTEANQAVARLASAVGQENVYE